MRTRPPPKQLLHVRSSSTPANLLALRARNVEVHGGGGDFAIIGVNGLLEVGHVLKVAVGGLWLEADG